MTILIVFAIRPTVSTILNLKKDIKNQQQILAALESKENALTEGRNNLQNLGSEKRGKITTALPSSPEPASLIASLRNTSQNQSSVSALQIQPVTLLDTASANQGALLTLGDVSFTYNVQGTYEQLLTTLSNLQKSPRLMSVDSITLGKQSEGSTVLSVTGKAYFLK